MKMLRFISVLSMILLSVSFVNAGMVSTEADIVRLKNDLVNGVVKIGKTRLKDIRRNYGDASNITDDEDKIIFEYDDLKIEFEKIRYWISWGYDGFKDKVYTDDVNKLREDLESEKLVGANIRYRYISRQYGNPTDVDESLVDGGISNYYYGDIRMTFENTYVLKKWRGKNLLEEKTTGILGVE